MDRNKILARVQTAIQVCESRRTVFNRLFLYMEEHDGKPITRGIKEKLEEAIPTYKVEYVYSKGDKKAVTFYPKNGKAEYTSMRFVLCYIPHGDVVNYADFVKSYGGQRNHNHERLMQLKQFAADADLVLPLLEGTLKTLRGVITDSKKIINQFHYMSDLFDKDDRTLLSALIPF